MRPGRKYCEYFSALSYVSLVILKPLLSPSEQRTHYAGLCLVLKCRKKANVDLGETNEFSQRRIYDDQNTVDLLRVVSETLGKIYSTC